MDRPKEAIIDFRRASQYYIGQGDLDKYRETRDLSLKIHFDRNAEESESQTESKSKQSRFPYLLAVCLVKQTTLPLALKN